MVGSLPAGGYNVALACAGVFLHLAEVVAQRAEILQVQLCQRKPGFVPCRARCRFDEHHQKFADVEPTAQGVVFAGVQPQLAAKIWLDPHRPAVEVKGSVFRQPLDQPRQLHKIIMPKGKCAAIPEYPFRAQKCPPHKIEIIGATVEIIPFVFLYIIGRVE